jgi:hypothetical protein
VSATARGWATTMGRDRRLRSRERLLLVVLADLAQDDGTHIFPYLSTLADALGWDERTVRRGLSTLRAAGLLTVDQDTPLPLKLRRVRGDRRPTMYRLAIAAEACAPAVDGGTRGDSSACERGDSSDRHGGTVLSPLTTLGTKNRNNYRAGEDDWTELSPRTQVQGELARVIGAPKPADWDEQVAAAAADRAERRRHARTVDIPLRGRSGGGRS